MKISEIKIGERYRKDRKDAMPAEPIECRKLAAHTKGPWEWRLFGRHLSLVAAHSGTLIVMDFDRRGMQGAEPRFAKRTDNMGGLLIPASEWMVDGRLEHPDANLISAAPELLAACKAAAEELHGYADAGGSNKAGHISQQLRDVIAKAEGRNQ